MLKKKPDVTGERLLEKEKQNLWELKLKDRIMPDVTLPHVVLRVLSERPGGHVHGEVVSMQSGLLVRCPPDCRQRSRS
ncbi:hypothetical protein Bpfe_018260 [Biomphalaria pfeifferi]|uniref:Uncharacterized protein n=1 Tax=Biomphalaria pfeifferi TaxID=112525 RepID=A0AAD8BDB0_BIOPF|nr:hypothetical protein Bpfe_018260 [Biomphalaria pfeifferi]